MSTTMCTTTVGYLPPVYHGRVLVTWKVTWGGGGGWLLETMRWPPEYHQLWHQRGWERYETLRQRHTGIISPAADRYLSAWAYSPGQLFARWAPIRDGQAMRWRAVNYNACPPIDRIIWRDGVGWVAWVFTAPGGIGHWTRLVEGDESSRSGAFCDNGLGCQAAYAQRNTAEVK